MSDLSRFMLSVDVKDGKITVVAGGTALRADDAAAVMAAMAAAAAAASPAAFAGELRAVRDELAVLRDQIESLSVCVVATGATTSLNPVVT